MVYNKRRSATYMTAEKKSKRLKCYTENVKRREEKWKNVMFSEKKKFNLNETDS